jgi:hypothetical protein
MIINQNINARIIFINTYKKLVIKKKQNIKKKKKKNEATCCGPGKPGLTPDSQRKGPRVIFFFFFFFS